ncbi:T9SS type A sorting domain-containing protein [candidate division KSB1 bacterium]|nr:T9SS type A sorting domain-containing protein [candidate division KSB1 bacterium]NIR69321.1 T9SS type A sorting domain-containing protein [candidate division KSB1 bacterium]NIS22727.1 T9SS type A sorting domain-containing protein [candidate division KSB1 bacterium]NIT69573.1 T9SS type A sorting domain-containing protein [candidate division KSB1 bacterium]NIU23227.1 T9SS type A sorting domain-containing protein [candidate division KSB1 bacterium]
MRNGFQRLFFFVLISLIHTFTPSEALSQAVQLTWRANPEPDLAYYAIHRATVSSPSSEIARVPPTDTTYLDTEITLGNIYTYRIAAIDSAGNESELSDEIMVAADIATPVEMKSFTAQFLANRVVLKWITATETNNFGFEVERSLPNHDFEKIGFVAGNGTVTVPKTYKFVDTEISTGKVFYRLKQIDLDGRFDYSDILTVNIGVPEHFELSANYPNPFNPETSFDYNVSRDAKISLTVYDLLGRKIKTLLDEFKRAGRHTVTWDGTDNFSKKVASGAYFVRFVAGDFRQVRRVLLQK